MTSRDRFRSWLSGNLAPICFLAAYFITVVLGNLIYLFPVGKSYLLETAYAAPVLEFETTFSFGFWALLLLPFFFTPLVVWGVKRWVGLRKINFSRFSFEFTPAEFFVILVACYAYVLYAFNNADALSLFYSGADAMSSVESRFQIRGRISFFSLVVLMSVLHYLSIYSVVRWLRGGGLFWMAITIFNLVCMSLFLILLNMKWPVLIYYAGLVLAIFVYAKRYAYLKTVIGFAGLVVVYLLVGAFVVRLIPVAPIAPAASASPNVPIASAASASPNVPIAPAASASPNVPIAAKDGAYIFDISKAALQNSPTLFMLAINRMAIIYPYYYEVFTKEGAVCGGVLEQARVGPECRPSTFIYGRIFGDDGFKGRGTAPAAVHISGYSLGGWSVALFALFCASIILGIFASLPLDSSSIFGALSVTGGVVGYHFSQLPGEGPVFYDHGFFWVILGLFIYFSISFLRQRFRIRRWLAQ